MAMEINGQSILASLAQKPSAFGMSETQLNALAMATLLTRLKDKTANVEIIRSIAAEIGQHDFGLAMDHLVDKDASTLAKRLDPKNPAVKTSDVSWQREQIIRLAHRQADPLVAAPKAPRSTSSAKPRGGKPKTGDVMESKALRTKTSTRSRSKS